MQPVPPAERVHEAVARQLRDAIISGRYRRGERLPIERELSERFGVSRSVVRQALLILDQQGLVRVRSGVGGGPFVTHEPLPAAIAAFENLLAVDPTYLAEFIQAKLVLEPAVNAAAAESISEERIAALEANLAVARAGLERGDQIRDLMIDFHLLVIGSIDNRFLALIGELMRRALGRLPAGAEDEPGNQWRLLAEHERMVDALRRHDVEQVRELTVAHLTGIWRHVIDSS